MNQRKRDTFLSSESDLTARRRWVPRRGMRGAIEPSGSGGSPLMDPRSGGPDASRGVESTPGREKGPLEWLIVGGGIHGTYLSRFLTGHMGVAIERIRVLDPYDPPLARWLRNTENVGMAHLRSAAVHHLDLASLSLKRFAATEPDSSEDGPPFIPPYGRPLLSIFNRHAALVIERNQLDRIRIKGRAVELLPVRGGYEVHYAAETGAAASSTRHVIATKRVILAVGMDDATCWPHWASGLRDDGARVHHVLDFDFRRESLGRWRSAVVYGGGLSGAQIAASLASEAPGTVTLLSGHAMEVHLFDSEPSWQGSNFMAGFAAEHDPVARRAIILRERHRGSLTPEASAELAQLQEQRALRVVTVIPESLRARLTEGGSFRITSEGETFEADLLILSTGYDVARPGGGWIDRAIERMRLPCAPCGFPIVAPSLEWRPGLFVSGPLAELELGPVARNISGAHRAATRIEYYLR